MKISIVTTTYNCEEYIKDTLEGVLNQKGDFEIEYILFDACSKDKTFEIIKEYEKKVNEGFFKGRNQGITMKAFQEKDEGMYDGISKGFKQVTGDIVAYINGDDYYLPYAFSTVVNVFSEFPSVKWISGIQNSYNVHGQNFFRSAFCNFHSSNILAGLHDGRLPFIQQESCFWRKELLDKIDLNKFKEFKLAGDFFLWHEFAKQGENLYTVDSILSGFRLRSDNKSSAIDDYYKEVSKITGAEKPSSKQEKSFEYIDLAGKIKFNNIISETLICWDTVSLKWKLLKFEKKEILKKIKLNITRSIRLFFLTLFKK